MEEQKEDSKNKVKSKIKKTAKKVVLKIMSTILPWILIAAIFFVLVTTIKDAMIKFLAAAQTRITSLWTWIADDQWIKLDSKKQFTGENDEYTVVEKYVKDLAEQGISLKELKLLGDFDFSNEDLKLTEKELLKKIIKNENNQYEKPKRKIEKYISEFIRADLITQSIHRRRGTEIVANDGHDHENENWIDGGVYLYRAKNTNNVTAADEIEDGSEETTIDEIEYIKMQYMNNTKFMSYFDENDNFTGTSAQGKKLKYKFTLDPNTGELLYIKLKTTVTLEDDVSNKLNEWFADLKQWIYNKTQNGLATNSTEVEVELVRVDYKPYISKYAMPYEFLINLCTITQNPEFVYHVALLARDTKIVLAIHDDETIEQITTETENEFVNYKNYKNDSVAEANEEKLPIEKTRRTVITTTTNASTIQIKYANSWSFYEEYQYTNSIETNEEESGPINIIPSRPTKLTGYEEGHDYIIVDGAILEEPEPGHWYINRVLLSSKIKTQIATTTNTYTIPEKAEPSIRKSKQFLGLLRNSTGECPYDCYKEGVDKTWNYAKQCAEEATFDRSGINVAYKIPNIERKEMPLNKLTSGIDMLYQLLGGEKGKSNESTGEYTMPNSQLSGGDTLRPGEDLVDSEGKADKDKAEDVYKQKMQGLVEHLQYLMTFPENEQYTVIDDALVYIPNPDNNKDDITILPGSDFWWPVDSNVECRISSKFGPRKAPTEGASTFHKGIDIARPNVNVSIEGANIIASADGVVEVSNYSDSAGYYITINHENGFKTRYIHNKENLVSVGQRVSRGEVIAHLGNTGRSTGPHLHFEILLNGEAQDPLRYVSYTNKCPTGEIVPVDDATKLDIIYAIVTTECSSNYEGALAVISCVLNRCKSAQWNGYGGNDPYAQITAKGQFSYGIEEYSDRYKKYLNGNVPQHVKQAVDDALNAGIRNHNYTSFRTDGEGVRRTHPNGQSIGGNWYF